MDTFLTLGQVARRIAARHPGTSISVWQIRRLFERRFLPPPPRLGQYRAVAEADLDQVESALVAAGYLAAREEVPA